jgi:hypothetical protein
MKDERSKNTRTGRPSESGRDTAGTQSESTNANKVQKLKLRACSQLHLSAQRSAPITTITIS